ncbi:MAG: endolytic transglycosylase MltG [Gordonia sp. (in: high G+C Gram-positive bacteria)]|uniref:endolytic transglycosylase MltG n=1 Tax=Gordonia sp. (in: high G+C Gram-positive bacteria) TaxID=84139 RepID=UPI003C71B950
MSDHDDSNDVTGGHRENRPPEGDGRRQYFADSMGAGQPGHRHRRRRAPGDPTTTGSIPIVRVGDSLPDPTIEYRTPEPPTGEASPYFQVRYRSSDVEGVSYSKPPAAVPPTQIPPVPPVPRRRAAVPPPMPPAPRPAPASPVVPQVAPEPTGLFDILDATSDEAAAPQTRSAAPAPESAYGETAEVRPEYEPAAYEPAEYEPAAFEPAPIEPEQYEPAQYESHAYDYNPETVIPLEADAPPSESLAPAFAASFPIDDVDNHVGSVGGDDGDGGDIGRAMPARKRNRKVVFSILALLLVVVLVLGGFALKALGLFDSNTDYDSATGSGSVLVEIPADASLREIGDELSDAGVVGSRNAFVNSVGNDTVAAGFYKLPKGISGQAAVAKMQDNANRVGRMVVPDGLQLDSKKGIDGVVTPGIFELISKATTVKTDDRQYGVSVQQLAEAASTATAAQLGIPSWAMDAFNRMKSDHRRIEGLIAAGTWEDLDPSLDAVGLLNKLITASAQRFAAWGLESGNSTGLNPYQTLITASIVEREARQEQDFAKVSRVILNRLKVDQRLEMDSTANYTAQITNIDVFGEVYEDENAWNTYQHKGLPITPIGAVGERALHATLNPASGDWLYFVTVDKEGTTKFSKTYEQQKRNREEACRNKFLTTGC